MEQGWGGWRNPWTGKGLEDDGGLGWSIELRATGEFVAAVAAGQALVRTGIA